MTKCDGYSMDGTYAQETPAKLAQMEGLLSICLPPAAVDEPNSFDADSPDDPTWETDTITPSGTCHLTLPSPSSPLSTLGSRYLKTSTLERCGPLRTSSEIPKSPAKHNRSGHGRKKDKHSLRRTLSQADWSSLLQPHTPKAKLPRKLRSKSPGAILWTPHVERVDSLRRTKSLVGAAQWDQSLTLGEYTPLTPQGTPGGPKKCDAPQHPGFQCQLSSPMGKRREGEGISQQEGNLRRPSERTYPGVELRPFAEAASGEKERDDSTAARSLRGRIPRRSGQNIRLSVELPSGKVSTEREIRKYTGSADDGSQSAVSRRHVRCHVSSRNKSQKILCALEHPWHRDVEGDKATSAEGHLTERLPGSAESRPESHLDHNPPHPRSTKVKAIRQSTAQPVTPPTSKNLPAEHSARKRPSFPSFLPFGCFGPIDSRSKSTSPGGLLNATLGLRICWRRAREEGSTTSVLPSTPPPGIRNRRSRGRGAEAADGVSLGTVPGRWSVDLLRKAPCLPEADTAVGESPAAAVEREDFSLSPELQGGTQSCPALKQGLLPPGWLPQETRPASQPALKPTSKGRKAKGRSTGRSTALPPLGKKAQAGVGHEGEASPLNEALVQSLDEGVVKGVPDWVEQGMETPPCEHEAPWTTLGSPKKGGVGERDGERERGRERTGEGSGRERDGDKQALRTEIGDEQRRQDAMAGCLAGKEASEHQGGLHTRSGTGEITELFARQQTLPLPR